MLLHETAHGAGVAAVKGVLHLLDGIRLDSLSVDVTLERRPAREAVLAREDDLRVGEGNAPLVGEHGADAGTCLGVAGRERLQELFRLLLLLREVRAIGQGTAEWR
jgi:hypothetical protein